MKRAATMVGFILLLFALFTSLAFSQSLPSKIRGYKVYETKVVVINEDSVTPKPEDANASVRLLKPKIVSIGLTGVTVEVLAESLSL